MKKYLAFTLLFRIFLFNRIADIFIAIKKMKVARTIEALDSLGFVIRYLVEF